MVCHRCGSEIKTDRKIGRQETCGQCGSFLHCCLNCRFYEPGAYHQCRETQSEWVQDKAGANFCEYFEPSDSRQPDRPDKASDARKKLDGLFGGKQDV